MVKFKNAHRNTIYDCNFWNVYTIYKCAYDNLLVGAGGHFFFYRAAIKFLTSESLNIISEWFGNHC